MHFLPFYPEVFPVFQAARVNGKEKQLGEPNFSH